MIISVPEPLRCHLAQPTAPPCSTESARGASGPKPRYGIMTSGKRISIMPSGAVVYKAPEYDFSKHGPLFRTFRAPAGSSSSGAAASGSSSSSASGGAAAGAGAGAGSSSSSGGSGAVALASSEGSNTAAAVAAARSAAEKLAALTTPEAKAAELARRDEEDSRLSEAAKAHEDALRTVTALKAAGGRLSLAKQAAGKADAALRAAKTAVAAAEKAVADARRALAAARQREGDLLGEGPPEEDDDSEDARLRDELQGHVDTAQYELDACTSAKAAAEVKLAGAEQAVKDLEAAVTQMLQEADSGAQEEAENKLQAAGAALDKLQGQRAQLDAGRAKFGKDVAEQEADFAAEAAAIASVRADLESLTGRTMGSDPDKTVAQLTAALAAAEKRFADESKRFKMSPAQVAAILEQAQAARAKYEDSKTRCELIAGNLRRMRRFQRDLVERFYYNRRIFALRVTEQFKSRMGAQGADASIEWTHAEEMEAATGRPVPRNKGEMRPKVAPDAVQRFGAAGRQGGGAGAGAGAGTGSSSASAGFSSSYAAASQAGGGGFTQAAAVSAASKAALQDAAMLSGGEKSTTTLQLLASIARHCNLPFRAHDEVRARCCRVDSSPL